MPYIGDNSLLKHDSDLTQICRVVQQYLDFEITYLDWPARMTDLNHIEHDCGIHQQGH